MKAGIEVRCPHRVTYDCTYYRGLASKAPKRAKCPRCGGVLVRTATVWAVVPFQQAGRYECPATTYPSPEAAEAACPDDAVSVVRSFEAK